MAFEGLPRCGAICKEFNCQCRRYKRHGFDSWAGKMPWSRKWQPTLVFLAQKIHGQKNLEGYSPQGLKKSDMTEHTHMHPHFTQGRVRFREIKQLFKIKNWNQGANCHNILPLSFIFFFQLDNTRSNVTYLNQIECQVIFSLNFLKTISFQGLSVQALCIAGHLVCLVGFRKPCFLGGDLQSL